MKVRAEIIRAVLSGPFRPSYYKQGEPDFPTICVCPLCHGITGSCDVRTEGGKLGTTKEEAFILACVQHGTYLEKWKGSNVANAPHIPTLCACECSHEWQQTSRPPTPQSGLHESKCVKCGVKIAYDTSD